MSPLKLLGMGKFGAKRTRNKPQSAEPTLLYNLECVSGTIRLGQCPSSEHPQWKKNIVCFVLGLSDVKSLLCSDFFEPTE